MKTKAELEALVRANLKRARDIIALAESENREFTKAEREEVSELMVKAQSAKDELKAMTDPAGDQQRDADRRMMDMVRELDGGTQPKSSGGAWSKSFSDRLARRGRKEILPPTGSVGVPSLSTVVPAQAERLETILQVIPTETTSDESVEYLREVERTQRAAPVAKGTLKPTSTYRLEEVVAPVETIAHLSDPLPNQWLSGPNLRRYLDIVLRQGLQLALEDQLVNGTGTRPELQGMLTVNDHVLIPGTGDLLADARRGITALELLSLPIEGMTFTLHPNLWESMELIEATGSGTYKLDPSNLPINRARRQLWGVPVAPSIAVPETTILLFHNSAVQLFEREGVNISWTENFVWNEDGYDTSDGFSHNLTKFRAEGQWVFCIYVASGIVEISLGS